MEVRAGPDSLACEAEHGRTDVDRRDGRTLVNEPFGERASAAPHFEHTLTGDGAEQRVRRLGLEDRR